MPANFRNISKEQIFKAKLSQKPIDLGFVPIWQAKEFIAFLIDNELIRVYKDHIGYKRSSYIFPWAYITDVPFTYWRSDAWAELTPLRYIRDWLITNRRASLLLSVGVAGAKPYELVERDIPIGWCHVDHYSPRTNMPLSAGTFDERPWKLTLG